MFNKKQNEPKLISSFCLIGGYYIFFAVSTPVAIPAFAVSIAALVVSIIEEVVSVDVETEVESADVEVLFELQAATDIVIAKAKKPNLNEFFIMFLMFF